jgi:hypothetical protein
MLPAFAGFVIAISAEQLIIVVAVWAATVLIDAAMMIVVRRRRRGCESARMNTLGAEIVPKLGAAAVACATAGVTGSVITVGLQLGNTGDPLVPTVVGVASASLLLCAGILALGRVEK